MGSAGSGGGPYPGLGLIDIEYQHRDLHIWRGLGQQMAVDEFQAIRRLAGQQRPGETDLGQHATWGVGLGFRVAAPVGRI